MVSILNLTVLRLSVGCCTSLSPLFSGNRGALRYSRFQRFTSVMSLNSFSEINGCQFRHFLNSAIVYTNGCNEIRDMEFRETLTMSADNGSCVVFNNCGFYDINIERSGVSLGGAISCNSGFVEELRVSGSQFSKIRVNGAEAQTKGGTVYFIGKTLDFSSNCVVQTGQFESVVESSADSHTISLNSFLENQIKHTLIATTSGQVKITHVNTTEIAGASSDTNPNTLILITNPVKSLEAGEITVKAINDVETVITLSISAAIPHLLDSYVIRSMPRVADIEVGDWTITRAWVTGNTADMSRIQGKGTITFAECYFQAGCIWSTNIYATHTADAKITEHRTIQQLALGSCRTEKPSATVQETWKLEGEAIGYLTGSIVGGILAGVVVFVGAYFGLKAAHRWYEKRKDRQYPGFNV